MTRDLPAALCFPVARPPRFACSPTGARIAAMGYSHRRATHDRPASRADSTASHQEGCVSYDRESNVGIRTPDQKLRVFVSSTLGELAAERAAVARAITSLRLTPVMFELGARPHPPR